MVFYAVFILVLVAIVATAITTFEVANNHGTTTSTASVSATVLYSLIFNQTGTCDNLVTYIAPWAVVLNKNRDVSTAESRPAKDRRLGSESRKQRIF